MTVQTANNSTATAFGQGYITTLDGAGYRFLGSGEYHVFITHGSLLSVQARMVTCYSSSSCLNAVAVKLDQTVLMIHAKFTTGGEPVVFLDGKQSTTLEFQFGPQQFGFVMRRVSRLRFSLSSSHGFYLGIRLYDRYLDLHMRIDNQTYCQASTGMWGNCNGDPFDDLSSRDGVTMTSRNVTQSYIHETYARSWKVAAQSSLFVYGYSDYGEQRNLPGGGYALSFENTGAHTGDIYTFSSSDITVEFMVRIENQAGTLLSYTTTETFAVTYSSGTMKLQCADLLLDTLAVVQVGEWNQIALVWSKQTRILQFYHMNADGRVSSRNFPISNYGNVFEPGGILALGYWRPAPSGHGSPPEEHFVGQIDELRIWNTKLDPFTISSNFKKNVDCSVSSLASLWKFNEREGSVAHDCVSSAHIYFHASVWRAPTWVFSTAPVAQFSVDIAAVYSYRREGVLALKTAQRKCHELIFTSSLASHCSVLGTSTLWYYYMSCVTAVTRTGHLTDAYWTMLAVADYCQGVSPSRSWYAQPLCQVIPGINFPEWIGPQCRQHCRFGLASGQEKCECMKGFYGANCTLECPGGYTNPCSGYNSCDTTTGLCACPATANVSRDCSVCSSGWIGEDCSVAAMDKRNVSDFAYCQGYGAGHYTTFDGTSYTFGTYGEYYVINSADFTVQVRQISCMDESFCISAVAVKAGVSNVTVRAAHTSSGTPLVWLNGRLTDATRVNLDAKLGFVFLKTSPLTFMISNNKTSGAVLSVRVKVWRRYLSFDLISDRALCRVASGLCSSCDAEVKNDVTTALGEIYWGSNITQSLIIDIFRHRWAVTAVDSMFIFSVTSYREVRTITANGFALTFNGTVGFTERLNATFQSDSDVTLQFFVKSGAVGGTIISYATTNTFAIVNDITVKIHFGGLAYDTRRALQIGVWTQMSVIYHRQTGE